MVLFWKVESLQKYLMCACVSTVVLGVEGRIGGVDSEVERGKEAMQSMQPVEIDVGAQRISP